MSNLSTQNYKGARDFYPEDMRLQRYIFDTWSEVAELYGYEEYDGPMLEFTDLYRAKTGQEIVEEQTYSFKDRGGRDVTMRPEITPTLARMVAARNQELSTPIRWYSTPNLWRYERPQSGRLREHWQFNVDILGVEDISAELEVITLLHTLMRRFGADEDMFQIRLNSRELMSHIFGEYLSVSVDTSHRLTKLLDRKDKMSDEAFINQADTILGDKLNTFLDLIRITKLRDLPPELLESEPAQELALLGKQLSARGINNIRFDLTIQRGFDYYTGIVFEVFDSNPDNARSIAGGGRYDDLMQVFKAPKIPAVGFGMGDVIMADFLKTHGLEPKLISSTKVAVLSVEDDQIEAADELAASLRQAGINTATDFSDKKIGNKIKAADKRQIPYVIVVGDKETLAKDYGLKHLSSGDESRGDINHLIEKLS